MALRALTLGWRLYIRNHTVHASTCRNVMVWTGMDRFLKTWKLLVPTTPCLLSSVEFGALSAQLEPSNELGIDLYLECLQFIHWSLQ